MGILSKTCDPERAEKLERVLRYPSVLQKWTGRKVHIYSTEHGAYWRTSAAGYTADVADAGVYSFEDALGRTRHCGPEKGIQFYLYPYNPGWKADRALPVALVYRAGHGCRQYSFPAVEALGTWAARHPYRNEQLHVMPILAGWKAAPCKWLPAAEAADFVRTTIAAGVNTAPLCITQHQA